ncbi:MAG: lamin tail domain-containing protein [Phycisphaerae bacterium]
MRRRWLYMVVFVAAGIAAVWFSAAAQTSRGLAAPPAAGPGAKVPEAAPPAGLLISEFTLDNLPGSEESWIEFYNPGDAPFEAGGVTLVCNGQAVFTFPPMKIPAYALVLVRFTKQLPDQPPSPASGFRYDNAVTLPAPPAWPRRQAVKQAEERQPGYCALFAAREPAEAGIMDFVCWGSREHKPDGVDPTYREWAEKRGRWRPRGSLIDVGIVLVIGGRYPRLNGALARMDFAKSAFHRDVWISVSEEKSSPGFGNRWPPLILVGPPHGCEIQKGDPLGFGWGFDLYCRFDGPVWPETARLQVARDPHFQVLVFDKHISSEGEETPLPPGRYYARARCEGGAITTEWTEPVFFRYHVKQE